jgi:hypothetical protein
VATNVRTIPFMIRAGPDPNVILRQAGWNRTVLGSIVGLSEIASTVSEKGALIASSAWKETGCSTPAPSAVCNDNNSLPAPALLPELELLPASDINTPVAPGSAERTAAKRVYSSSRFPAHQHGICTLELPSVEIDSRNFAATLVTGVTLPGH